MKVKKLQESNELQARAKKHKKNSKGLSPFCTLNTDAGNVEHNVDMFNQMNSPIDGPANNPVSGPHGGNISSGMSESVDSTYEFVLPYAGESDADNQWSAAKRYNLKYEESSKNGGYIKLIGSRENLESYCNAYGQDVASIQPSKASVNESTSDTVELHYDDLEVTIVTRPARSPSYHFEYDRDEAQTVEETVEYDYSVPKSDVVDFIYENMDEDDFAELETATEQEIVDFINKNFDQLFTKYESRILDHYRDRAREEADLRMNESVSLTESVDYTTEQFLIELGQTQDEEIYKMYLRKDIDAETASLLKKTRAAYMRYARVDDEDKIQKLVDKVKSLLDACPDRIFEELVESFNEYVIMAVTQDGKKQYYNVSSVPHWVNKGADASIFDDMDEARAVWFKLDKKPFKRVFIPNYDHEAMNESIDDYFDEAEIFDDVIRLVYDILKRYCRVTEIRTGVYRLTHNNGTASIKVEFDMKPPRRGYAFRIDGGSEQVARYFSDAKDIILYYLNKKHIQSFDVQLESMNEDWTPPENWMSYKGAWIYPVEGGYEANFTGEHFEAATLDELKAKLQAARVHRQKFTGYSDRDAKMADMIKSFGREITEDTDDVTRYQMEERWNPNLVDCPACGDVSFDSKRGRCTRCSYRESLNKNLYNVTSLKEYYRGNDSLDDVLDWLQDHAQAWDDFCAYFADVDDEDLTFEMVLDWISDHETLYNDYLNFFCDDEDDPLDESVEYVKWVQMPDGKWKMWGSNPDDKLDPTFLDRARKRNNIEYLDAKVVKNGESPTGEVTETTSTEDTLDEASYGGAFDIADDQYFTRDDLVDCAEKVIEHLNETFDDVFEIYNVEIDGNTLQLEVEGKQLGWYMAKCKVDMRKIRVPSDLTNKYALALAAELIATIKDYNEM